MDELRGFPPVTQEQSLRRIIDDLAFDSRTRQVWHGERLLGLTKIEYDLLLALVESCGSICTPQDLMNRVWGCDWMGDSHVVETHIGRLRAKLGESGRHPSHIHTVRGVGYRFQAHPDLSAESQPPGMPVPAESGQIFTVMLRVTASVTGEVLGVTAETVAEETVARGFVEFA